MQESIKRILSETLTTIKTKIGKLDSSHYQKFYRHKREENNGWSSTPEDRVNINAVYSHKNINWENESRKFGESFFREYPNYHNKIQRIGTELGAYTSFEPYLIVRSMAGALYRSKTHPVKITNREINSIVEQFSIFMDNPKIKIQCIAPLAGFYANGIKKHITVKKGLTIRKFSNQEINDLFTDTHY